MDNEQKQIDSAEDTFTQRYVPRPAWQVWGARIGLVVFLIFVAYQILSIARGGL